MQLMDRIKIGWEAVKTRSNRDVKAVRVSHVRLRGDLTRLEMDCASERMSAARNSLLRIQQQILELEDEDKPVVPQRPES
jgi:hypothetical protein